MCVGMSRFRGRGLWLVCVAMGQGAAEGVRGYGEV